MNHSSVIENVKLKYFTAWGAIAFLSLSAVCGAAESSLQLSEVIQNTLDHNPELKTQRASVEADEAVQKSAPSIPPPTLFLGAMGTRPLQSNGQMENSIGVSQTIPFPTKLTSESKEKRLEAEASEARLSAKTLELTASAKAAFYDLYGMRKKIELLEEKKTIFEDHSKRLRASALSDRIVQGHRVWVLTEIALIENDLIAAHEGEQISQGKLNVVMGNTPEKKLPELKDPPLSELPKTQELSGSHPEVRTLELKKNAAEAAVTGAKSLWLPDLSLQYRNARRFDGLMPNYSEVSVGVTLPFLFFWEPKGLASAASARAQAASFKVEKVRQDLKQDLLEARARAASLRARLLNYDNKILPQAGKRMTIAHGLVPSDMESLREHREAMESLVDLRLSELSIRVDYEKAIAKLESLLSTGDTAKEKQE
jgi:outer membrane protein TolC